MSNYTWLRFVRSCFMDEADYASFCWIADNLIALHDLKSNTGWVG